MGGTLGGDGTITTVSAFNTFNGVTIASGTTVEVADGTVLDLVGIITDAGTIALDAWAISRGSIFPATFRSPAAAT